MKKNYLLLLVICLVPYFVNSQITDMAILNKAEMRRLKALIKEDDRAKSHYDSIVGLATQYLQVPPHPLEKIHYEGLLQTNPDRIATQQSLEDVDRVVTLIYAWYGNNKVKFARKAKEITLAWANTYQPDGNTINENKLVPFFWAWHLFRDQMTREERSKVENWMVKLARAQMERPHTPNNNWEAKRLKIIGTVGCVVGDKAMRDYSIEGFKKYINTAYYPDGTSNDLKERDALHYHISGLTPTIGVFINCSSFDPAFDLFDYFSSEGSSIRKSVEYTIPYASGERKREEWTNSKVALDKKRAEAGLTQYQPGMLFDPVKAKPMFEWACFYNTEWYKFLGKDVQDYTSTWIGILNSPLIRRR
jgi:hypothetical protein